MFGGIGPYAVLASSTAQALTGANLANQSSLAVAMAVLQDELVPDQPPVATSAAYRVAVACGLLYKYYLSFLPNLSPTLQSGTSYLLTAVSQFRKTSVRALLN